MATKFQNLSSYDFSSVPSGEKLRVAIAVAEWNYNITGALLQGAVDALMEHGVREENIFVNHVPGTFELSYAAAAMMDWRHDLDAIIVIGCVVRGDTPHFDYICQGVSNGITELNVRGRIPVIFGVLTTNTMEQAEDRAGGKHGNKGVEAAITAIKMAHFACE